MMSPMPQRNAEHALTGTVAVTLSSLPCLASGTGLFPAFTRSPVLFEKPESAYFSMK